MRGRRSWAVTSGAEWRQRGLGQDAGARLLPGTTTWAGGRLRARADATALPGVRAGPQSSCGGAAGGKQAVPSEAARSVALSRGAGCRPGSDRLPLSWAAKRDPPRTLAARRLRGRTPPRALLPSSPAQAWRGREGTGQRGRDLHAHTWPACKSRFDVLLEPTAPPRGERRRGAPGAPVPSRTTYGLSVRLCRRQARGGHRPPPVPGHPSPSTGGPARGDARGSSVPGVAWRGRVITFCQIPWPSKILKKTRPAPLLPAPRVASTGQRCPRSARRQ